MKTRRNYIIIVGMMIILILQLSTCKEKDIQSKVYHFEDMYFSNALYELEVKNEEPLIEGELLTFITSFKYLGREEAELYSGTVLIKLYIESVEGENPYDSVYVYTDEGMIYSLNQGEVIENRLSFNGLPAGDYKLNAFTGILELDGVLHEGYGYEEELKRVLERNPNNLKMHDYVKSQIFLKDKHFTVGRK